MKTEPNGSSARTRRRILRVGGIAAPMLAFATAWVAFPFPVAKLAVYPEATVLLDREGRALRVRLGTDDADCRPQYEPGAEDWICKAIVAVEDRRFRSHPGVDPIAILRAAGDNLRHGRVRSGASTISTQVIRLVEPRPRTLATKLVETFRALQMERRIGKDEILAQYLNRAPFGGNAVGVESASRRYFGKSAHDLSLAEAALLAGLPQSPTRLRPDRHPDRARRRQAHVLDRMVVCGVIDETQRAAALAQPLAIRPVTYPFRAPHFAELAFAAAPGGGMQRTTLDPGLQRAVEEALRRHAAPLAAAGIHGAAAVVIEVRTGAVRALAGSPDYRDAENAGQVNGAASPRSAGSTLKPFAFALAIDQGRLTPGRVLADVPRSYAGLDPRNFDNEWLGLVSARDALVLSLNLPALGVAAETGVEPLLRTLRTAGLDTLDRDAAHYGLGLVLGNGSVTLLDLANAYAAIARGGEWRPCRWFEVSPPGTPRRVMSAEAAWIVADMLGGEERSVDTVRHTADARLPRMAWKTGTSSGFRDAWAVAINPEYAIGVWCGRPDGRGAPQLVGTKSAVPVVWEIFRGLYPANDGPWFARPAGVAERRVCAVSGMPPGASCGATVVDWTVPGVTRHEVCGVHRRTTVTGPGGAIHSRVREVWPPEVQAFLDRSRVVAARAAHAGAAPCNPVRIVSPVAGSVYRRLGGPSERIPLAAAAESGERLWWFVDDRPLASVAPGEPLLWPLEAGRHILVCADASGRSDRVPITVE
ncbi:MAG: penicillin-binding protein 1C [Verrucomicrobia bacterium]|nr:penicillin-binding protein 1C [Verrucomicrobiota bacterium]